jgi:hypothetical protein
MTVKTWMMVLWFWGNAVTLIMCSLLYSELQGIPLQLQLLCRDSFASYFTSVAGKVYWQDKFA